MSPVLAPSPHLRSSTTIETAMYGVILALLPATVIGFYFFGLNAIRVTALSIAGCLILEGLVLKMRGRDLLPLKDGSALLTGLLLAMNLPSGTPWWMVPRTPADTEPGERTVRVPRRRDSHRRRRSLSRAQPSEGLHVAR